MFARRGSCIAPFLFNFAMFRYPQNARSFRGSAGIYLSQRRSWALVPSQCYSCSGDFGAFPLLFPHMPSMNFHLGYFSRDRPTDTFNLFERLEA